MRYCSKCGNQLTDDQLYCPKCGHKEPFITNSEQSEWNNFETDKKYDGNVNYDFQNKKVVSIEKPDYKDIPKPIQTINKVTKLYGLLSLIIILPSLILNFVGFILNNKAIYQTCIILNWVSLALFAILFVLTIVRTCIYKSNKLPIPKNGVIVSCYVFSILGIGASIGQYFMITKTSMGELMPTLQLMFMLASTFSYTNKKQKTIKQN